MKPTAATFEAIGGDLGIELSEDHMRAAVADHARLRPELEELRALPLSYLDLIEPATPVQWIANGGRLPARSQVWDV